MEEQLCSMSCLIPRPPNTPLPRKETQTLTRVDSLFQPCLLLKVYIHPDEEIHLEQGKGCTSIKNKGLALVASVIRMASLRPERLSSSETQF